ncbi:TetR/AcrR family transcriptional regulator [Fodinicurvata sediminis]|uniref:TetR/AcrR family transcriptional regulator n=1 Tax=Fodinicurvata sediminis TaxID=1121832 RepID=UPI0003B6B92F|nr:TetR/AcrR family transcriptional regulator [Fodinicurvata sediminis]
MTLQTQSKRGAARGRILDQAEMSVLEKGFASTSIEELITGAGVTKSAFFYHFRDKNELARAMMERYIAHHDDMLADILHRADELHEDPLHSFLVAMKLFEEMMADLPGSHPGCLVTSFVYQDRLFSRDVRALTLQGFLGWRELLRSRLERIAEIYPPCIKVDLEDLADMAQSLVEGGIVVSRLTEDPQALPRQIQLFRSFVRMVFLPQAQVL